jgi:hypothetical protein
MEIPRRLVQTTYLRQLRRPAFLHTATTATSRGSATLSVLKTVQHTCAMHAGMVRRAGC